MKQLELEMQKVYGEAYDELLQGVRKRQHDFKNQLGAIYSTHLVANSLEELVVMQKEYGDGLIENCKYDSILTCCENSILAGYLYHRCIACEKDGVNIVYDIRIRAMECNFALHEIIEVLGILIDNACENTKNIEGKEKCIRLYFREETENIIFAISNKSKYLASVEIEKMFRFGYSTKGKNRGIGLARALELVRKNNSEIKVANHMNGDENWIEFTVIIPK